MTDTAGPGAPFHDPVLPGSGPLPAEPRPEFPGPSGSPVLIRRLAANIELVGPDALFRGFAAILLVTLMVGLLAGSWLGRAFERAEARRAAALEANCPIPGCGLPTRACGVEIVGNQTKSVKGWVAYVCPHGHVAYHVSDEASVPEFLVQLAKIRLRMMGVQ